VLLIGPRETERERIARETREAERRITEIGRQAQAAILAEALRRARAKHESSPPQPMVIDGEWP
jgi:hypothetical protein